MESLVTKKEIYLLFLRELFKKICIVRKEREGVIYLAIGIVKKRKHSTLSILILGEMIGRPSCIKREKLFYPTFDCTDI